MSGLERRRQHGRLLGIWWQQSQMPMAMIRPSTLQWHGHQSSTLCLRSLSRTAGALWGWCCQRTPSSRSTSRPLTRTPHPPILAASSPLPLPSIAEEKDRRSSTSLPRLGSLIKLSSIQNRWQKREQLEANARNSLPKSTKSAKTDLQLPKLAIYKHKRQTLDAEGPDSVSHFSGR